MPARSKRQFRYMKAQKDKKVSKKTSDEYTKDVPYKSLPETVGEKVDKSKKRTKKRSRR